MLSFVTAALMAGSVLCSGVDVVGPKKTVKIPYKVQQAQVIKTLQSAGLKVQQDSTDAEVYHATDTTNGAQRQVVSVGFNERKMLYFIERDTAFSTEKSALDYADSTSRYYEGKVGKSGYLGAARDGKYEVHLMCNSKQSVTFNIVARYNKVQKSHIVTIGIDIIND